MNSKNHPKVTALAIRGGLCVFALAVIASGLPGQDTFDKDAFLSRKKWYLSFTVRLKGADAINKRAKKGDGYDKLEWNILREVSGVIELGTVKPGQFPGYTATHMPTDSAALIALLSESGRFIGWNITAAKDFTVDRAAMKRGEFKMQGDPRYLPVFYTVSDRVQTESLSYGEAHSSLKMSGLTRIQGGGTAYMSRSGSFTCDLKEMRFDLNFDGARAAAGGFRGDVPNVKTQRETHSREESLGVDEDKEFPLQTDKPDSFLPAMTETLRQQLVWRKLDMHEGKIAFTVSEPVTKLPFGFDRDKKGGPPLELSIDVVISPNPPSRAKLILKARDYETWRPLCSNSEDTKGNDMQIDWRVEEEGGDPANPSKVRRVAFSLLNTSKEPGVCMNYPLQPKTPADFDLKFETTQTPRAGYGVASDGQKLTLAQGQVGARKGSIAVDCFDSGATGVLVAEAELEDGRVLTATVEGTGGSQLMIPDFEPGVSWIARGWRAKNASGKKDDADDEKDPVGDGQVGDGLTVWEEYRGFWVGGRWDGNCDPKTKDLFIFNGIGGAAQSGLWLFGSITGLRVHDQLAWGEIKADLVVNFNKGARPHLVDQHCIVVTEGGYKTISEDGVVSTGSICRSTNGADFPGPPKNTMAVSILPAMLEDVVPITQDRKGETYSIAGADLTICHELGHGLGIRHHGDKDLGARPWTFVQKDTGELITYADGVPVKVWNEKTGAMMVPSQLFPRESPGDKMLVWIGERNGQHGGDEACVMRYDVAQAYRSQTDPNVLYYHGGPEIMGNRLCTSPAGTGVNMPTHEPQSRYFGADAGRGNCAHKFVVSDHWEKIH